MKPIKISENLKKSLLADFEKYLTVERMSDSTISYTTTVANMLNEKEIPKPTVQFTPEAWLKMKSLVMDTSSEIGWHGTVVKQNNLYLITDILLYPQKVTAATVSGDDELYVKWLMQLPDKTFNKLRFQGHSHVYMGTSPSGVDSQFYDSILKTLEEGDYYIFCIMNKKDELNVWIYDFAQNIIFEKADITVEIKIGKTNNLKSWLKMSKETFVKSSPRVVTYPTTPPTVTAHVYPTSQLGRDPDEYYAMLDRMYGPAATDPFYSSDGYNRYNRYDKDDKYKKGKKGAKKNESK